MEKKILGADAAAVESAGSIASDAAPHVAHTPGPWVAECSTLREACEYGGFTWAHPGCGPNGWTNETRVGSVYLLTESGGHTGLPGSIEVSEANAHLIAAAPELLEALKWLTNICAGVSKDGSADISQQEWNECNEQCRAALTKAEGRS